jgi:hypothetical protein
MGKVILAENSSFKVQFHDDPSRAQGKIVCLGNDFLRHCYNKHQNRRQGQV